MELDPVVDCLEQLEIVKDKTFSWELEEEWEEAIELYTLMFAQLQVYCSSELNINMNCTWKTHIITGHLKSIISRLGCGLGMYAEQTGESIHHWMKPVLQHHRRKSCHPNHGPRQQSAIVESSSNNLH